jgi:hypothetical protein
LSRFVLDANIVLASFVGRPDAPPALLLAGVHNGDLEAIACPLLIEEVRENLAAPYFRGLLSELEAREAVEAYSEPGAPVARMWQNHGMGRMRVSTTVDQELLASARRLRAPSTDAALIDEALAALLARHRAADIDAAYAAYDEHPLEEPDAWGDLASFREAAAAS